MGILIALAHIWKSACLLTLVLLVAGVNSNSAMHVVHNGATLMVVARDNDAIPGSYQFMELK